MQTKKENVIIVLNKPKFAGNVGAVARCAKNMGMDKLCVVGGSDLHREEMYARATHVAADLVDNIHYCDDLPEALEKCRYVVGTTARTGSIRGPLATPRQMAEKIVDVSQNNEVALLFGSEDRGLTNEELHWCHLMVNIPTSGFTSLNLSHAVMVLCYEILVAETDRKTFTPKIATAGELEGMYNQIADVLQEIGFLRAENPDYWMTHIRRFLSRTPLLAREVKIIRGICRQLDWYGRNYRKIA